MPYKLPDVYVTSYDGSSHAASGGGTIEVESFSWGVSQTGGFARPAEDGADLTGRQPQAAAFDAFLTLDGIKGESADPGAAILETGFADLVAVGTDDAGTALGAGHADWRSYRVSVDSIE